MLRQMGVEFHPRNRGGDITYHGPGQLVGYPILNLGEIRRDVVWYVRQLEEAMIRATAEYRHRRRARARMHRSLGERGRTANAQCEHEEKLGAIGVHISRWVTSHGLAYNVSTDLRYFDLIVPCGIADSAPLRWRKLLGRPVQSETKSPPRMARHLGDCFGREMRAVRREELGRSACCGGTRQ